MPQELPRGIALNSGNTRITDKIAKGPASQENAERETEIPESQHDPDPQDITEQEPKATHLFRNAMLEIRDYAV